MPAGWQSRPFRVEDLEVVRRLYEQNTARAVGAVIRTPEGRVWSKLARVPGGAGKDACRVAVDTAGEVRAYAWRGAEFWPVEHGERYFPDALAVGEVVADGPASADAILAVCRRWAVESSPGRAQPIRRVQIGAPLEPEARAIVAALFPRRHPYMHCPDRP